jgi:hypothetical protein
MWIDIDAAAGRRITSRRAPNLRRISVDRRRSVVPAASGGAAPPAQRARQPNRRASRSPLRTPSTAALSSRRSASSTWQADFRASIGCCGSSGSLGNRSSCRASSASIHCSRLSSLRSAAWQTAGVRALQRRVGSGLRQLPLCSLMSPLAWRQRAKFRSGQFGPMLVR